jgi:hypothetical protein
MAITLNEAIEKSPILLKEIYDDLRIEKENRLKEEAEEKEIFLKQAVEHIDRLIALDIARIKRRPVDIATNLSDTLLYKYSKEINEMYSDFTIETYKGAWGMGAGHIRVKLAGEDWDWQGYGIKQEPIDRENKKLSFTEKLKQWL